MVFNPSNRSKASVHYASPAVACRVRGSGWFRGTPTATNNVAQASKQLASIGALHGDKPSNRQAVGVGGCWLRGTPTISQSNPESESGERKRGAVKQAHSLIKRAFGMADKQIGNNTSGAASGGMPPQAEGGTAVPGSIQVKPLKQREHSVQ